MSKIHWIHISDLHLNMVGTQTSTLRDDLPSYIQNIAKKEKIQYIFITGDLSPGILICITITLFLNNVRAWLTSFLQKSR